LHRVDANNRFAPVYFQFTPAARLPVESTVPDL
jgi:hypothetical protein